MTFESRNAVYTVISTIISTPVNDCFTARLEGASDGREFTLVVVKEHETVKSLMDIMSRDKYHKDLVLGEDGLPSAEGTLIESFSQGKAYVMVFPYRQERPLEDFFVGEAYSLTRCEDICTNLLLGCISCAMPFPVLYMILDQGLINLTKDDNIYFSYSMDLTKLDDTKTERDCAVKCADIMLKVLETKSDVKNISYELLSKKSANNSYSRFTELYRDLRIAATPVRRTRILIQIKSFFHRNADLLFGILFWISLILAIVALVLLFTHLVWGDVPFLRIFFNSFKNIGTESLTK